MRTVMRSLLVGGVTILNCGLPGLFAQQPTAGPAGYGFPAASAPAAGPAATANGPASAGPQANLVWYDNVDMALRLAATQRKFVLIHFWNDNCPPCVAVEKAVLSRPEVQQAIGANFIPVKIKVDDQPDAARRFRVDRWPMDVVLSPDGTEIYRNVSSQNPGQYTAILGRIATTARGAASAVQDVTRSANSWADRMAGAIPNFGAAPTTNSPPSTPAGPTDVAAAPAPGAGSQFAAPAASSSTPPPAPTGAVANFQTSGSPGGAFNSRSSFQPDAAAPMDPPQIDMGAPAEANASSAAPAPTANRFGGGFAPPAPDANSPPNSAAFPPNSPVAARDMAAPPPARSPVAGVPASGRPQQPAAPVETASQAPLGLDGFCPVTLQETRRWRRADARWGAIHRDRTYLFAGPEEQRRFLENPDRYAPMLSGYDPVRYLEQGQLVDGRRQHGVWFHNQMYLFTDETSLERFWKNPDAVVPRVEQAMRVNAAANGNVRR
jgi:YHS domain-containing protein/thiol-disulfide isomerase/thioredoxin